jgi:DNA-binding transcriptional MerR regulator
MTNSKRTIGKLAAEAGVGLETIRYYERRGLLRQPPRRGAARNYGDEALWRLRYIKVGKQWGLSLREMRDARSAPHSLASAPPRPATAIHDSRYAGVVSHSARLRT